MPWYGDLYSLGLVSQNSANRNLQLLEIAVLTCFIGATHHGLGRHLAALTLPDIQLAIHWIFWHGLLVVIAVSLVKISIAFFLLRLASRTQYKRFLYGVIGEVSQAWARQFQAF